MASRSQARLFAQLLSRLEPEVRQAFMRSVVDLHANVDWSGLLRALESGNTFTAIQALNIHEAAFAPYSQAVVSAFMESGTENVRTIIRSREASIGLRFDVRNPRAERWIERNVASKVVGFVEEQVGTVRNVINTGYALGQHPHTIAVDLVGRVGNSGVREGGVLGLDGPRAERLYNVSQGMRTAEGVQDLVVDGASGPRVRYKVNKATETRILSAYRKGEAVSAKERVISERQYSNALLKQRSETIAATETAAAVMGARDESWHQAAEEQGLEKGNVIKTWRHRRGPFNGRQEHIEMAGVSVTGLDTPFILPDGTAMQHSHDPAGGGKHNINCACSTEYRLQRRVS